MNRKPESHGKCIFCNELFASSSMTKHLQSCEKRKQVLHKESAAKRSKIYGLKIWATYNPAYWLFLEVDHSARFENLDNFLRKTWLECCGHLSAFTIQDIRYELETDSPDLMAKMFSGEESKTMGASLGSVLSNELVFHYEYDFGSTTDLDLKVLWERKGRLNKKGVTVLSRNEPIGFKCTACGQIAEVVCAECGYEKDASYCSSCAAKHECGEEMLLPVVNSPRMGVCGYEGAGV